jgi:hypothetical protein
MKTLYHKKEYHKKEEYVRKGGIVGDAIQKHALKNRGI